MPQAILIAVLSAIVAGATFAVVFARLLRRTIRTALDDATDGLRGAANAANTAIAASVAIDRGEFYAPIFDAGRVALPMSSGVSVPIGASVEIASRPHNASFRPDRIIIGSPEAWTIDAVTIDDKPQIRGAIRADRVGPSISWGVVGQGKELVMTVTYVGDREEGAPFICTILGVPLDLGGPVDPRMFVPDAGVDAGAAAGVVSG